MALPNFELYEELKKDVSERAARLIAEVVPQADDLVTNATLEARLAELKAYIDSRLLRFTMLIIVLVCLTMIGTVGALIALVVKL